MPKTMWTSSPVNNKGLGDCVTALPATQAFMIVITINKQNNAMFRWCFLKFILHPLIIIFLLSTWYILSIPALDKLLNVVDFQYNTNVISG